jgi:hypothetical protein
MAMALSPAAQGRHVAASDQRRASHKSSGPLGRVATSPPKEENAVDRAEETADPADQLCPHPDATPGDIAAEAMSA